MNVQRTPNIPAKKNTAPTKTIGRPPVAQNIQYTQVQKQPPTSVPQKPSVVPKQTAVPTKPSMTMVLGRPVAQKPPIKNAQPPKGVITTLIPNTGSIMEIAKAQKAAVAEQKEAQTKQTQASTETVTSLQSWFKAFSEERINALQVVAKNTPDRSRAEKFFQLTDPATGKSPKVITIPLKLMGAFFEGLGKTIESKDDKEQITPLNAEFTAFCSFDLPDDFLKMNPKLTTQIQEFKEGMRRQCIHICNAMFDQGVKDNIRRDSLLRATADFMSTLSQSEKEEFAQQMSGIDPESIPEIREMAFNIYMQNSRLPINYQRKKGGSKETNEKSKIDVMSLLMQNTEETPQDFEGFYVKMPVFQLKKGFNKEIVNTAYRKLLLDVSTKIGREPSDRDKLECMLKTGGVKYNLIELLPANSSTPLLATEKIKARESIVAERIAMRLQGKQFDDDAMKAKLDNMMAHIDDPFRRRLMNGSIVVLKISPEPYAQAGEKGYYGVRYEMDMSARLLRAGSDAAYYSVEMIDEFQGCETADDLIGGLSGFQYSDDISKLETENIRAMESSMVAQVTTEQQAASNGTEGGENFYEEPNTAGANETEPNGEPDTQETQMEDVPQHRPVKQSASKVVKLIPENLKLTNVPTKFQNNKRAAPETAEGDDTEGEQDQPKPTKSSKLSATSSPTWGNDSNDEVTYEDELPPLENHSEPQLKRVVKGSNRRQVDEEEDE